MVTLPRIAAELRDVVAHPFERGHQVQHARVAGIRVAPAIGIAEIEMAEQIEAMVYRNHHHTALRQIRAVHPRAACRADLERATMEVDHHREPRAKVAERRRKDGTQTGELESKGRCASMCTPEYS